MAQILPGRFLAVFKERVFILCFLLLFVIGAAPQIYATHFTNTAGPGPEKEIGLWLRANRPDSVIMARKPRAAYYAGSRYVPLPFAFFAEIKNFARLKKASILIIDEKYTTDLGPHLAFLLEEGAEPDGLKKLKSWNPIEGRRIVAYEFEDVPE